MLPEYLHYYGYSDFQRKRDVTQKIKRADPHIHTPYSDGALQPERVLWQALEGEYDAIAITDHNETRGAEIARNEASRRGYDKHLEVISGEEISTADGHVLALYIDDLIPPGEPVEKTIQRIHEQGGLAIAAHPHLRFGESLTYKTLARVMRSPHPDIYWDGIEVFNFNSNRRSNKKARRIYDANKDHSKIGAAIASSDAHGMLIGNGLTIFQGKTFKEGVKNRMTAAIYAKRSRKENLDEAIVFAFNVAKYQTRIWRGLPVYP